MDDSTGYLDADRVIEILRERRVPRKVLAANAYISSSTLSRALKGGRISLLTLDSIARVLDVHPDEITKGRPKKVTQLDVQQPEKGNTVPAGQLNTSPRFDVFISYTAADSHIAEELRDELIEKRLSCFMAEKDVRVGIQWNETIRNALIGSSRILLLVTPRSIQKHWPLMETGAAWVLGKEIIPALINIDPKDLPDPIAVHQARVIETTKQRQSLVNELSII